MREVIISGYEAVSAYGVGMTALLDGLYAGRTAISLREEVKFKDFPVAVADDVAPDSPRCLQLLERLKQFDIAAPAGTPLFLALTIGAIEYLEQAAENAVTTPSGHLEKLIVQAKNLWPGRKVYIVSAACAASSCAIARAASMISAGEIDSALIVSCDSVSEFIVSGFSSLGALDKIPARPFDENRQGLSLGEGAGMMLLAEKEFALKHELEMNAMLRGWAMNCDAHHVTSPDLSGAALSRTIADALANAGLTPADIDFIAAHGTGTYYNDQMESEAFRRVFNAPVPIFSIKGGTGHTVATAGILQLSVAVSAARRGLIPPNINLNTPMSRLEGWLSAASEPIAGKYFISVNSGFGGINCTLAVETFQ